MTTGLSHLVWCEGGPFHVLRDPPQSPSWRGRVHPDTLDVEVAAGVARLVFTCEAEGLTVRTPRHSRLGVLIPVGDDVPGDTVG